MDINNPLGRGAFCLARKDVRCLRFPLEPLWWYISTGGLPFYAILRSISNKLSGNGACKDGCCCYLGYGSLMVC